MDNLPNEILQKIFSFLSGPSLFYAGMVSARWRSIIYGFYLKESAMINWKAIALEFMDPNILSELIQEYSVTAFNMITGEKEEPVTSYDKLVSNAIWRKNLSSYEPRQTSFLGDEDIGTHINITEISIIVNSGDILLTHCHDKESLTMNTLTGKILKKTNQKNITHIELVNLYSRQVDICGGIYSKHDHFFLLVRNGLIKFMRMKDFATIGLIELYHGLQLKNICFDKPFLYVYDGHYGVTGFSLPSLQRCKRESVDGLDSFKVTNGTLCYIEDSGKYYSAEKQVKFSYTLQPFSINMVHYITAVCEKSPLNLEEEHFNSKIFRTDCVCLSVRGEYYLTMDGENYRSLNVIKSEYGTIKDVCVNGPTVAIGLHTGDDDILEPVVEIQNGHEKGITVTNPNIHQNANLKQARARYSYQFPLPMVTIPDQNLLERGSDFKVGNEDHNTFFGRMIAYRLRLLNPEHSQKARNAILDILDEAEEKQKEDDKKMKDQETQTQEELAREEGKVRVTSKSYASHEHNQTWEKIQIEVQASEAYEVNVSEMSNKEDPNLKK